MANTQAQSHCRDDLCHDDDNDHHHAKRTSEQQRAFYALLAEFASWERVLASALPENRADLLRAALIDLYRLAAKAGVNHAEISDWGCRVGELHNIGADADGLQAITVEAIQIVISEKSVPDIPVVTVTAGAHQCR